MSYRVGSGGGGSEGASFVHFSPYVYPQRGEIVIIQSCDKNVTALVG